MTPVLVRFNSHEEFLDELRSRPPNLERLVRLSCERRMTTMPLALLTVVATYIRRPVDDALLVVELRVPIGEVFGRMGGHELESDREVKARVEGLLGRLREVCLALDLEVGEGRYLTAEPPRR